MPAAPARATRRAPSKRGARATPPAPRAQGTGARVLEELARQREVIQGAQRTLDGADGDMRTADGLLKAMSRRARWLFG